MATIPAKPTDGELEILQILWEHGPQPVRGVHEKLGKSSGYTTTLKIMQIMHEKGLVDRDERSRSHVYTAMVSRQDTQGGLLARMIDTVFNGSAVDLVLQALGGHKVSPGELEQIRKLLDEAQKATPSKKR